MQRMPAAFKAAVPLAAIPIFLSFLPLKAEAQVQERFFSRAPQAKQTSFVPSLEIKGRTARLIAPALELNGNAKIILETVDLVNEVLPPHGRTRLVWLGQCGGDSVSKLRGFDMTYHGYEQIRMVFGTVELLSDSLLCRLVPFHEQAHAYFAHALRQEEQKTLWEYYDRAICLPLNFWSRHSGPEFLNSEVGRRFLDLRHPIFSLFDESNYIEGADWHYGHPWGNENEMFASASTVLGNCCFEFLRRLDTLRGRNLQHALFAAQFARHVLFLWKEAPFFERWLGNRLDLTVKAIKKDIEWQEKIEKRQAENTDELRRGIEFEVKNQLYKR